jgi:hypothetical protein
MIKKLSILTRRKSLSAFDLLFDREWYVGQYPDVLEWGEPKSHYVQIGYQQGRRPNPLFDPLWYLENNPDVGGEFKEPLLHYSEFGYKEGRNPHPLFDPTWYLSEYPDVAEDGSEPLSHYLRYGHKEGRRPHPLFDPNWYLACNPDVSTANIEPFTHYILHGSKEGRRPNPLFNPKWYLAENNDVLNRGIEPFYHYLAFGFREGRKPNSLFDPRWYVSEYTDVRDSHIEPLTHYAFHGLSEGRGLNPSCSIRNIRGDIYSEEFALAFESACVENIILSLHTLLFGEQRNLVFFLPEKFSAIDAADGFGRRVRYIDDLLSFMPRLYVSLKYEGDSTLYPIKIGHNVWQLDLNKEDKSTSLLLDFIIEKAACIYVHSVFSVVVDSVRDHLLRRSGKLIFDAHGLVPEEFQISEERDRSQLFSEIENWCVKHADYIVTVSKMMSNHFSRKYFANKSFIVLPFLCGEANLSDRASLSGKAKVIYAGGVQQWQNISSMASAIEATIDDYEFSIYTSSQSAMRDELQRNLTTDEIARIEIVLLPNDLLLKEMSTASYGFLLRKNSIVNQVSCPTKLVEYLSCGVVPILDSNIIGDFTEMGLNYITLRDFISGSMPTESERVCMAGVNNYVLRRYRSTCEDGMRDLIRIIFGRRYGPAYFIDDSQGISFNV